MKTERGIFLELEESNYIVEISDFKFYFSSKFYKKKFISELDNFTIVTKERIRRATKTDVAIPKISCAILLYKQIEKRGFLIYHNEVKLCREKVKLMLNTIIPLPEQKKSN